MNWLTVKRNVIQELDASGIKCRFFKKKYLNFRRRVNTCQNLLKSMTWDSMEESKPFSDAHTILEDIKENHKHDWEILTGDTISDYFSHPNVVDFLA